MFILMKFNNEHYTVGWRQLKVRTSYKSLLLQGCVTFYGEFSLHFRAPPPYFPNIFYYRILFIIEYKRYMSKKQMALYTPESYRGGQLKRKSAPDDD